MVIEAFEKVKELETAIHNSNINNKEELEAFRIQFLGTKNCIKPLFAAIRDIPNDRKKEYGQLINAVKQQAEQKFEASAQQLLSKAANDVDVPDLTAPAESLELGSLLAHW